VSDSEVVTARQDDEHLDPFELWARDRLEPLLGSLRVIDKKGGPPRLHDFEADLPGGLVAALEVTSEVEQARLKLTASAHRRLSALTLPGSTQCWQVGLAADACVNAISPRDLLGLLSDLENQGLWRALNRGDSSDPFVGRLAALGIESAYAFTAKPGREGIVTVDPGFYFGREWGQAAIDTWLCGFLADDTGANKLRKLGRAKHASERHLVIVLHPLSQAGMGIPLGLTDRDEPGAAPYLMPSLVPPEPLTHVWLLPTRAASEGLRWEHDSGWTVLQAPAA
jgi:hypothetical protein